MHDLDRLKRRLQINESNFVAHMLTSVYVKMVVPSIMIMDYVCMCRDVRVCRSLLHVVHTNCDVCRTECTDSCMCHMCMRVLVVVYAGCGHIHTHTQAT